MNIIIWHSIAFLISFSKQITYVVHRSLVPNTKWCEENHEANCPAERTAAKLHSGNLDDVCEHLSNINISQGREILIRKSANSFQCHGAQGACTACLFTHSRPADLCINFNPDFAASSSLPKTVSYLISGAIIVIYYLSVNPDMKAFPLKIDLALMLFYFFFASAMQPQSSRNALIWWR